MSDREDTPKTDSMMYGDAKITAVSLKDEITRCEQLEEQLRGLIGNKEIYSS